MQNPPNEQRCSCLLHACLCVAQYQLLLYNPTGTGSPFVLPIPKQRQKCLLQDSVHMHVSLSLAQMCWEGIPTRPVAR